MSKKPSQRFETSGITRRLVPILLGLILLGLLAVVVVTALAVMGITPGR